MNWKKYKNIFTTKTEQKVQNFEDFSPKELELMMKLSNKYLTSCRSIWFAREDSMPKISSLLDCTINIATLIEIVYNDPKRARKNLKKRLKEFIKLL